MTGVKKMPPATPDALLVKIARYARRREIGAASAYECARYCLMDAIGCALQAFEAPDCTKLLGPVVPGTIVPHGARVPGTSFQLDPVTAAFNTACLIRWLDYNDSWFAGGHPSDNIGGILAAADHASRMRTANGKPAMLMREVLGAIIKAYEVQGLLAMNSDFGSHEVPLDTIALVKIASTAAITQLLGGTEEEIVNALSHAFIDGHSLNTYRKMPNSGTRKSWAAADATSRAVWLAWIALRGEMGYASALTAATWGFQDVLYCGRTLSVPQKLGSYAIENVGFKIDFPAQRHAQTAAECAVKLHPLVKNRLHEIKSIEIATHELALKKISVKGPLPNYAARDHCLEYIVATALIFGEVTTASYEDNFAADPRIDGLRAKMQVCEDADFSRGYYDQAVRSNANAVQVFFNDGTASPKIEIEYQLGDARRRSEGRPALRKKFSSNIACRLPPRKQQSVEALFASQAKLERMPVQDFMDLLAV